MQMKFIVSLSLRTILLGFGKQVVFCLESCHVLRTKISLGDWKPVLESIPAWLLTLQKDNHSEVIVNSILI